MENKKWRFRPQIFTAMLCLAAIGLTTIFVAPGHIEVIAGGVVTALGMLGMKLLEGE